MTTTTSILRQAKAKIDTPGKHIRYIGCLDGEKHLRFCAAGAVISVSHDVNQAMAYLNEAAHALFGVDDRQTRQQLWKERDVFQSIRGQELRTATERDMTNMSEQSFVFVNNVLGWQATMEMFDYAIKLAEADEEK